MVSESQMRETKKQLAEIKATMRLEGMPLPVSTQEMLVQVLNGEMTKEEMKEKVIEQHLETYKRGGRNVQK